MHFSYTLNIAINCPPRPPLKGTCTDHGVVGCHLALKRRETPSSNQTWLENPPSRFQWEHNSSIDRNQFSWLFLMMFLVVPIAKPSKCFNIHHHLWRHQAIRNSPYDDWGTSLDIANFHHKPQSCGSMALALSWVITLMMCPNLICNGS